MSPSVLLLGFGLGLVFVLPPGPVAVTLVEVGVAQGRAAGVRSGVGIAAGDVVVATVAATLVIGGGVLPAAVFDGIRLGSSLVLVGLGVVLITRPAVGEVVAGAIRRPGRALFAMTVLTPTVLGAWVALIAALPFSTDVAALTGFIAGAAAASIVWHVTIGSLAAEFGRRLRGESVRWITRAGGAVMAGLGLATLAA